jgi:hypothetical protein
MQGVGIALTAVALLLAASAGLPHAAAELVIQIDLNDHAAAQGPPNYWNTWGGSPTWWAGDQSFDLYDTGGIDTTYDAAVGGGAGSFTGTSEYTDQAGAFASTAWGQAAADYWFVGQSVEGGDDSNANITFTLDKTKTYKIEVIGSRSSAADRKGVYTVNDTDPDGTAFDAYYDAYVDGYSAGSVIVWDNVAPDATTGEVVFKLRNEGSEGHAYLSAMRVTEIPEPATMGLLGLGALAGLASRTARRRRRCS